MACVARCARGYPRAAVGACRLPAPAAPHGHEGAPRRGRGGSRPGRAMGAWPRSPRARAGKTSLNWAGPRARAGTKRPRVPVPRAWWCRPAGLPGPLSFSPARWGGAAAA